MMQLIDIIAAGLRDDSGVALDSGTVTVYQAGTTTPVSIYSDYEGLSPLSNPATLDSVGRLDIWVNERVKLLIKNSAGSTIRTIDDVGVSDAQIATAAGSLGAGNGLSSSGGSLAVNVDGSTLEISGDALRVKDLGIGTAKLAAGAVTQAKRASLGEQVSSSSGAEQTTTSTSASDVTGLTVSITTTGRPVFLGLISDGSGNVSIIETRHATTGTGNAATFYFLRDSTEISRTRIEIDGMDAAGTNQITVPPSSFWHVDVVAAGTYTYKVQFSVASASGSTAAVSRCKLVAFEL